MRQLARLAALALALVMLTGATPTPTPTETPTVREREYWIADLGIDKAWAATKGKGVTIAVLDKGIVEGPPAFAGVVGGADMSGVGAPNGRKPVDVKERDHGSWVASMAAARDTGDPGEMIGVAPEASLLSVSLGFGDLAAVPFDEQVAKGIVWAVDHGADIINLSFTTGRQSWPESWDDAFLYAMTHDVLIVVAAGNRGSGTTSVGAPATIPGVLTVGGVDPKGKASVEASTQGITIGVAAPSEELLGIGADGTLSVWPGTSGAAPIVAGVAALVEAAHPGISAIDVMNRIIKTAKKPADVSKVPDPLYGYGVIDAHAAVTADVPSVAKNPMGDLAAWVKVNRRQEAGPLPTQTAAPVEVPPLPPVETPPEAGSSFLPSAEELRTGTLPLFALCGAGILVVLGVIAAVRRARSARVRR